MTPEELKVFNQWLDTIPRHVALDFRTMLNTGGYIFIYELAAIVDEIKER